MSALDEPFCVALSWSPRGSLMAHSPSGRPAALLDVDGTLVPESLGIRFTQWGYSTEEWYADGIAPAVQKHKDNPDAYPYDTLVRDVLEYWGAGMHGRHKPTVARRAAEFIADYDIPPATQTVVRTLVDAGFDLYFISVSPQEVLDPFVDRVCDVEPAGVYGTVLSVTDNQYTGSFHRNLHDATKEAILPVIFDRSIRAGSIAMGDSTLDLPLLQAAETGVVVAEADNLPDDFRRESDCWDYRVADVGELADVLPDVVSQ